MHGTYNYGLVFVSYIVSVLGALTALQLAEAVTSARTQAQSFIRILSAAIAMGGGGGAIWSMHFIAMVAHQTPVFVTYDTGITLFSAVVAIGASAVGMEAMLMSATIQYNMPIVALSVVIAVVAATAALWLAFNLNGLLQMLASAPIMGVAVCGMHYTGMAATNYIPTEVIPEAGLLGAMSGHYLGISIFLVVGILLGVALPFCYLWNREQQMQGNH